MKIKTLRSPAKSVQTQSYGNAALQPYGSMGCRSDIGYSFRPIPHVGFYGTGHCNCACRDNPMYCFLWTKSIRATILIHMINNILNAIIAADPTFSMLITGSASMISLVLSFIGLIVTVIMLGMLYNHRHKNIHASLAAVTHNIK